jgi:uncharacterized protein YybS (DUF2232 family)
MIVQKYKKNVNIFVDIFRILFSTLFCVYKIIICCKYRVSQQNGLNFSEI